MKATLLLAAVLVLPAAAAVPQAAAPHASSPPAAGIQYPAARAAAVPQAAAPHASWDWPLSPRPAVLRAFDPPDKPWMSGHRGVDLRAAHDGVPVASPEPGTVSFVGVVVDRPVITIDHGDGLRSSFEPVESPLKAGDVVAKGEAIGTLQPGHCGVLACVHWGVRRGDSYVNPLDFVMDLRPSILLPLTPGLPMAADLPVGPELPIAADLPVGPELALTLDDG
ncbi:M23 family metallopeptidase [Arthrobacter sp. 754]|uniref:M23 family metallopeptidase n=1 Tax=Arthrobacter sp. 754 TaxID=3156315 RepID=UPI0033961FA5